MRVPFAHTIEQPSARLPSCERVPGVMRIAPIEFVSCPAIASRWRRDLYNVNMWWAPVPQQNSAGFRVTGARLSKGVNGIEHLLLNQDPRPFIERIR